MPNKAERRKRAGLGPKGTEAEVAGVAVRGDNQPSGAAQPDSGREGVGPGTA